MEFEELSKVRTLSWANMFSFIGSSLLFQNVLHRKFNSRRLTIVLTVLSLHYTFNPLKYQIYFLWVTFWLRAVAKWRKELSDPSCPILFIRTKWGPCLLLFPQHSPFECLYVRHKSTSFLYRFDRRMRRKRTNRPHPHPLKNKLHVSKLVLYNHKHSHCSNNSQLLWLSPRLNRSPRGLLLNQQHNLWLWRGRHELDTASKRRHKESYLVVR